VASPGELPGQEGVLGDEAREFGKPLKLVFPPVYKMSIVVACTA